MTRIGIYPGTFDPITSGHLDVMLSSLKAVDKLYVGVAIDSVKSTLFTLEERVTMIKEELKDQGINEDKIEVTSFKGLLVNFAKKRSANIIIRGLRAVSDFEFEFQMACMNSILDGNIQTMFIPASVELQLVSSTFVKEVTRLGGDVGNFVSDKVKNHLIEKYGL